MMNYYNLTDFFVVQDSDDVVAVISKSLAEAVSPVSPVLYLILGCQHGAVPHSEVSEPSPLPDLRRIVPGNGGIGKKGLLQPRAERNS